MCGIIGYAGSLQAPEVIIDGLKKLEYRGYDSAGISVFNNGICLSYNPLEIHPLVL